MWKIETHPRTFHAVYANRLFVLYRVPPRAHSRVLVTSYSCVTYTQCRPLPRERVVTP